VVPAIQLDGMVSVRGHRPGPAFERGSGRISARMVGRVDRDELVDVADLLGAVAHPAGVAILDHVDEVVEASPRAFTTSHGATLAAVSHHFRMLARSGLIHLIKRPRRGAVEHFYVLSDRGQAVLGWLRSAPRRMDAVS
jgi:DNA-binding transcriptional ArsR family regulator